MISTTHILYLLSELEGQDAEHMSLLKKTKVSRDFSGLPFRIHVFPDLATSLIYDARSTQEATYLPPNAFFESNC